MSRLSVSLRMKLKETGVGGKAKGIPVKGTGTSTHCPGVGPLLMSVMTFSLLKATSVGIFLLLAANSIVNGLKSAVKGKALTQTNLVLPFNVFYVNLKKDYNL